MLRGRLALASVFLCFVCLLTLMAKPARVPCSPDTLTNVNTIIEDAKTCLDSRLYTPTAEDFQQNCPKSTLKCFAEEIKVLFEECVAVGRTGKFRSLEKLSALIKQTESECRQCEVFEEKPPKDFLEGLRSTLHMNEENCNKKT